jgi:hypothetical protein
MSFRGIKIKETVEEMKTCGFYSSANVDPAK